MVFYYYVVESVVIFVQLFDDNLPYFFYFLLVKNNRDREMKRENKNIVRKLSQMVAQISFMLLKYKVDYKDSFSLWIQPIQNLICKVTILNPQNFKFA